MSSSTINIKSDLIEKLVQSGCIKYGEFKLKGGLISPYYIDLRDATMHPKLLESIINSIQAILPQAKISKDWDDTIKKNDKTAIVGVPYGVWPLAMAVATESRIPYYPVRKEEKQYGHKSDETLYNDYKFILIEDVMSTGSSIIDTIKKLGDKKVSDVIVIVNREFGGEQNIRSQYPDINVHSVLRVSEIPIVNNKKD